MTITIEKRRACHNTGALNEIAGMYVASYFWITAYRPRRTRKGIWIWQRHKELWEGKNIAEFGKMIVELGPCIRQSSQPHNRNLNTDELIARDAAIMGDESERLKSLLIHVVEE